MTTCCAKAKPSWRFLSILFVLLVTTPIVLQSAQAQATPNAKLDDKAMSFLRDVIQLDVNHYKVTLTNNNTDSENCTSLNYKLESNTLFSWGSSSMYFQFTNDTLTLFDIQSNSNSLAYTPPRSDRFNETLAIMERYQTWINDPQIEEMVELMRQVGSEQSGLRVSGNLSLQIQQYSNTGQYSFCNHINGVEYTGITISTDNSSGSLFFRDNRITEKIGNTTIGISKDQAITIAQNYVNSDSFRAACRNDPNDQLANVNITGIRSVTLKASARIDNTWYPFYDVEFEINNKSAKEEGLGVDIGANEGENWGTHSYSSSTANIFPSVSFAAFSIFALFVIVALIITAVYLVMTRKSKPITDLKP